MKKLFPAIVCILLFILIAADCTPTAGPATGSGNSDVSSSVKTDETNATDSIIGTVTTDTNVTDTGVTGTVTTDTNVTDTGIIGTVTTDTNVTDTVITDTNVTTDTATTDTNVTDTVITDTNVTTDTVTDTNVTDTVITDTNVTTDTVTDTNVTNTVVTDTNTHVTDTNVTTDTNTTTNTTTNTEPPPPVLATGIEIVGKTTLEVNEKVTFGAIVSPTDAQNKRVRWSSFGGVIDRNGIFYATKEGTYTVTATADDGSGVSATITVVVGPAKVSEVTISGGTSVIIGNTLQLTATVTPSYAANTEVTWSITSGSSYATISETGLLTAIAEGSVTVKATAKDGSGKSDTHTVKVKPVQVSSITIGAPSNEVSVGKTLQMTAVVTPDNAANKEVTWKISSGSSYASIDENGLLTAKKKGSVTVKATAKDGSGVSATFKVTVTEAKLWDGSGTKSDPFLIRNLEDLMNLQTVTKKSGYYYRQVADIDCASVKEWIVIGDDENPFRHNYDGGNYTISNLCLDGDAQALFCVVEDSHFKNMKIVNAHTKDNHQIYENNTAKHPGNGESTAAIVGRGIGCSFDNCTATVNFLSSNSCTGGLIGSVMLKNEKYTLMNNCHVSGTITGNEYVGGLIGNIDTEMSDGDYEPSDTITIKNCSANVDIKVFTFCTGTPCIGGLIGKSFGVLVEKCHTTGTIDVIDGDIGGLIGDAGNYTNVTRCYSEMDISISSDDHYGGVSAGGLIGHIYSRSDVYDCYATGDITAPYVEWSPCQDDLNRNGGPWRKYYNPCGSLIGTLEVFKAYSEDQKVTIYNCYATGKVNVPNICEDKRVYCHGALIGLVLDRYTVVSYNIKDTTKKDLTSWDDFIEYYIGHFGNNYNLEDLRTYYEPINDYQYRGLSGLQNPKYNTLPRHEYVEIITKAQLTQQGTFEGWDFQNVWKMTANGPELR